MGERGRCCRREGRRSVVRVASDDSKGMCQGQYLKISSDTRRFHQWSEELVAEFPPHAPSPSTRQLWLAGSSCVMSHRLRRFCSAWVGAKGRVLRDPELQ
eukprot:879665-Rhodomonas_salina.1